MGGGIKRPGGPINPMEQLKRQSGSGMLMTRALGVGAPGPAPGPLPGPMNNPQQQPGPRYPNPARPQAPGQLRPRNQVPMQGTSGGVGGMGQPRPPVQRGNGPATGAQSVGSGSTGSFYADQPSKPADGTNYVGGGLWHTDQKADEGSASTMDRPTVDHRAYLPNDPRLVPQRVGGSTPLKANLVQPVEQDNSYQQVAPAGQGQQSQGSTSLSQQPLQNAMNRSPMGGSFNMRQNGGQMAGTSGLTSMRGQGNGMSGQGGAQPSPYTMGGAGSAPVSITPQGGGGGGGGGGGSPAPAPAGIQQASANTGSQAQGYSTAPEGAPPESYDENGNYNPWHYSADELDQYNRRHETLAEGGYNVDPSNGDIYDPAGNKVGNINDAAQVGGGLFGEINRGREAGVDAGVNLGYNGSKHNVTGANLHPGQGGPAQQDPNAAAGAGAYDALSAFNDQPVPQMDEAALKETDAASSAAYAQKRARAIRGMAEAGAYAGAGAEQAAGQQGEAGIQYDLAAGAERARNHLQAQIQNFQAQMDHYQKGFQIAMAQFQQTQHAQDFENALKYLDASTKANKELAAYKTKLDDSYSAASILPGVINGFTAGLGNAAGRASTAPTPSSTGGNYSSGPYGT